MVQYYFYICGHLTKHKYLVHQNSRDSTLGYTIQEGVVVFQGSRAEGIGKLSQES